VKLLRKKRRQPPVTVASLRLFLRSSTGPNRRFQPQSLGRVRDPVRIAEGPTHDCGFSILDCGLKEHESHCRKRLRGERAERTGPPTLWYLGNVDGPQCHANQVVPATSLVDDAMTPARKKGIVDQAGKPDLLPCRDNGFPAIRRRLTHGRVRYSPFLTRRSHCIVERNSFRFLPPNSIARSNGKVQRNEFRSTWKNEASVAS